MQGQFEISNSGTFVGKDQPHAATRRLAETRNLNFPTTTVVARIARELAGGGDQLRLVDQVVKIP